MLLLSSLTTIIYQRIDTTHTELHVAIVRGTYIVSHMINHCSLWFQCTKKIDTACWTSHGPCQPSRTGVYRRTVGERGIII